MLQLDIRSRVKKILTPTPSDLRNPTPPQILRQLATPTPQPWRPYG